MSQGRPIERAVALRAAERLVAELAPACERIDIAGSLRRGKEAVRDIEIVAIPRVEEQASMDLWATPEAADRLDGAIGAALRAHFLAPRYIENHRRDGRVDVQTKLGPAFKALIFRDIAVDLFIVRPPATWGCIYALRTGPGDWNIRLVTECKAIGRRVAGGRVERWAGREWLAVPTPEEADFFRAIGQAWVEPPDRAPMRVRIDRSIAERGA